MGAESDARQLLATLAATLPADTPLVLALSGGLDSTLLLHALIRAGFGPRLRAVHVNHGLDPQASAWAAHCQRQCADLGVACRVEAVTLAAGGNLEARAREARYRAIDASLDADEVVVLAHHRDDQAETVLFRLLRGAGVPALAGMRVHSQRNGVSLWRPLLDWPRDTLAGVARLWQLDWVDDPSNQAERFDRNFLRHQVLPLLQSRWPAGERLVRAGEQFAEAGALLDDLARADAGHCLVHDTALSLSGIRALSGPRRRNLVTWWLRQRGFSLPERQILERLDSEVLAAGDDRNPVLRWPDGALARHGELLWCLPLAQLVPLPDSVHWDWRRDPELSLDTAGALQASTDSTAPDVLRLPSTVGALTVKRASGGERILLRGMHRQVSELWRVAGVPPWQRQRLPLLYAGDALVAVAGIGVADDWQVPPDAPACCIRMCA